MERLPDSPDTSDQPRRSRRRQKPGRKRLVVAAGSGAGLLGLGIAFGVGAVPVPLLSASTTSAPQAAMMKPASASAGQSMGQSSASPIGIALAKMPASLLPHHSASAKPSPSKTSTPTQTPTTTAPSAGTSTSGSGLTPQPTAQNQTPRGQNELAWSEAILTALRAPLTTANIVSIGYWMQNEAGSPPYGIVGANNPINVSEPGYGGWPIQSDGDGVTYLMSYPSVQQGLAAIAAYLERPNYTGIVADLRAGVGLNDPSLASEIGLFAGGHYTTIPDAYGASQGTPPS